MDIKDRAAHASRLLEDSVLQEAFLMVEKHYTNTLISERSNMDDVLDARQSLFALKRVQAHLRTCITDGKVAERKDK